MDDQTLRLKSSLPVTAIRYPLSVSTAPHLDYDPANREAHKTAAILRPEFQQRLLPFLSAANSTLKNIRATTSTARQIETTKAVKLNPKSVLLVTLDSCRYDSFLAAHAPKMNAIGPLHRAKAPANFTFGSHAAIFVGFTPGVPEVATPFVNPKFAKIFKMAVGGFAGHSPPFLSLEGRNIIDGFRRKGFATFGSGAVGWFNPETATGAVLSEGFDEFFFPGNMFSLEAQIAWAKLKIQEQEDRPVFLFLNVGETHVPYFFKGAPWDPGYNPCVPFGCNNDSDECRRRQIACIEYVDSQIIDLLDLFARNTVVLCADHGDCWGEDGVWEHGISHPKVFEVPLIFHLGTV